MPTEEILQFYSLKEKCKQHFSDKELWPSYFERRYLEFLTCYELMPSKKYVRILELGCGMGYYSAFLSKIADEVVATDLEVIDPVTHSIGLEATRDFLKELDITNIKVVHASAEDLPFEDNSFDMVFSSHVLEHVPNSEKAIREINRVLKQGGINFCIVPTTTDRLYSFFSFYIYLTRRSVYKLFKYVSRKNSTSSESVHEIKNNDAEQETGFAYYKKYLPFPPPHGATKNYLTEVRSWTFSKWRKKLNIQNQTELVAQYGLQQNPLLPMFGNSFPKIGVKAHSITRRLENKLGKIWPFKHAGISTLIITKKIS